VAISKSAAKICKYAVYAKEVVIFFGQRQFASIARILTLYKFILLGFGRLCLETL
jgi:hypothetical protein